MVEVRKKELTKYDVLPAFFKSDMIQDVIGDESVGLLVESRYHILCYLYMHLVVKRHCVSSVRKNIFPAQHCLMVMSQSLYLLLV